MKACSLRLQQHLTNVNQILTKYKDEADKLKTPLEDMLNIILKLRQIQIDAQDPDSIYYHIENNNKKILIEQLEQAYTTFNILNTKQVIVQ